MNTEHETLPAPRIRLFVDVEYRKSYSRQGNKGVLKNISLTGAFLETEGSLSSKDKLVITFQVSGRQRKVAAQVVWSSTNGVGIKFMPTNNRDVQIVDDLMYFVTTSKDSQRNVLDNIFKRLA